jgi:excisionase family DNA binding protein
VTKPTDQTTSTNKTKKAEAARGIPPEAAAAKSRGDRGSGDNADAESVKPLLYSVAETCKLLGLSQSSIYLMINAEELEAVRFGSVDSVRITRASIERLLEAGKERKPRDYYHARKRVKVAKASAS